VLSSDDANGKSPLPPLSSDTEIRDELRAIRRELAALRAASGRDDEPGP